MVRMRVLRNHLDRSEFRRRGQEIEVTEGEARELEARRLAERITTTRPSATHEPPQGPAVETEPSQSQESEPDQPKAVDGAPEDKSLPGAPANKSRGRGKRS